MTIVRFAIVFWATVFLSDPALASFESARKYYAALDVSTRVKITLGLIATGDYDGLAALGFTRRYYKSVIAFQKREKFKQDGELGPEEIALLVRRFEEFSKEVELRPVRHPRTGSEALMPYALAGHPRTSRLGLVFERDDQKLEIEMAAFSRQERTYRGLFNAYTNTRTRTPMTAAASTPSYSGTTSSSFQA